MFQERRAADGRDAAGLTALTVDHPDGTFPT